MLPRTSILKYNLWRSLNHPVAYHCLLKRGSIYCKMQQVVAFVKTLTETECRKSSISRNQISQLVLQFLPLRQLDKMELHTHILDIFLILKHLSFLRFNLYLS